MPTAPHRSRRAFLKTSALGAAGAFAGLSPLLRAQESAPKVNVAFIGVGSRGRSLLKECLLHGGNVVALCDADERQLAGPAQIVGSPRLYEDYRLLLRESADVSAVVIATPDHWHAPLCRAALAAGKHVYCEKPLTRTLAEARELRTLARAIRVATQLGNQGSATATLRRSVELVQAGVLGQVRDVYTWTEASKSPDATDIAGADPVPASLNWDLWLGPAPERPFKKGLYHPGRWRNWYDFGSGRLGDFGCHGFNLPMRALGLIHPDRIEIAAPRTSPDRYYFGSNTRLHFPARGSLAPVTLHWHDGDTTLPTGVLDEVLALYPKKPFSGCMLVGEKGFIYATIWGDNAVIKLHGEERPRGVLNHDATRDVPTSLPRTENHMQEWLQACLGQGRTFSDFVIGAQLTEISLLGALALRLGRNIDWDGDRLQVPASPGAGKFIRNTDRTKWL